MIRTKWPVKCTAGLDGVRAEDANRYTQEAIDSPAPVTMLRCEASDNVVFFKLPKRNCP